MSRIVLAMSGGVDSSVAAFLLKEAGHDVIGVFMRHGETLEEPVGACATAEANSNLLPITQPRSNHKQGCCTASDAEDARRVADRLDIPFYAVDFQDAFGWIMDYFAEEYSAARTPNPCVMCNNWVKFGKLFDYADSVGAEFVATGHYARLAFAADGSIGLFRGLDDAKDQSYVLFGLDREVLPRVMFPIGERRKPEIRELAARIGLRVADKRDSQEICFVTSGHHADFVRRRRDRHGHIDNDTRGDFVTTDGRVVGRHEGIEAFTIGQRKGLGIALGEPHFVVRIEPDTRRVVLGKRDDLATNRLTADRANWLVDPPTAPRRCLAKIRYNTPATSATVLALPSNRLDIQFDEPVFGVAPGQAVVCYDKDRVLGGGWIESPTAPAE
jgi:tRNA-specific 2-thiouridylase